MNAPAFPAIPASIALPRQDHWHAEIKLGFTRVGAGTVLSERWHRGPLRVQKALYPEGQAVCQILLLHPPSGIAGGDQLQIGASVGPQAHAQITTPGAGKWYRSAAEDASQNIDFTLAPGARLEWLPQETIVFDGARSRMKTTVQLAADSRYLGWEILCLGRRAAGERFTYGHIGLHTRIDYDGRPIWLERGHIAGNDPLLDNLTGWAGASVCGTLLASLLPGDEVAPLLAACRAIPPADAAETALTALPGLPGLLIARYLGHNSEAARHWFIALWQLLRPALMGRTALPPRIWTT